MKFSSHPSSDKFKENEFLTLQYLCTRGQLLKNYSDLAAAINLAYYKYKADRTVGSNFNFYVEFDMEVEKAFHKVIVGANVTGDFDMCSYFLAILGKDDESDKVIRKYHFDYAKPSIPTQQPVPTYHLQYGGKLSHHFGDKKDIYLSKWLSVPRLAYSPVNLALLLDLMFCEFNTIDTVKVVEDSEWRDLILENETFLTHQYYSSIYEHIKSQKYSKLSLIRDYYYNNR